MKISKYNFFLPYESEKEKYIAYNSLSNSMALINKDDYEKYRGLAENDIKINNNELVEQLKLGGFLIDDEIDEKKQIQFNMYKNRFENDKLSLTLAPTSDCNFRCIYCYEKDNIKNTYMNKETQGNLIKLVKNYSKKISHLNIGWYGGEPLLAMDIIENLSKEFISICRENNISYYASMVTNGYNLTRENIEKINEFKISLLQITLDGDEKTHNSRRFLKGGQPTYSRIINNIISNKEILPETAIRINVDSNNSKKINDVINILVENQLQSKVKPYLGHVINTNDCYSDNKCLRFSEYCDLDYEFEAYLISRGFTKASIKRYPQRIGTVCSADTFSSHVINANGDLYRCWSDLGDISKKVGNVNNKEDIKADRKIIDFMIYDPTEDEKCKECKHLPICMGGCPMKVRDNIEDRCSDTKFKLESYLNNVVKELKNAK